ncbi:MAG: cytochrome c3 family protein [Burkholderiales bacterium]|jgi:fumarate reductase flavoprotein subunit|nr:cytochrome c3 family protein [Burkholderiales bacterium]
MKKTKIFLMLVFFLASNGVFATDRPIAKQHATLACESCHDGAKPAARAAATSCIKCHGDYAKLAEKTKKTKPNPHQTHQGNLRCTVCHKAHEPSVLYCNECHTFDIKVK